MKRSVQPLTVVFTLTAADTCVVRLSVANSLDAMTMFAILRHDRYDVIMEADMATMNVSLPDPMKEWVEAQARTGRYSNASDYVRDLIRRDQERSDKIAAMQRLVDDGLASGISGRSMDEILADARTRAEKESASR